MTHRQHAPFFALAALLAAGCGGTAETTSTGGQAGSGAAGGTTTGTMGGNGGASTTGTMGGAGGASTTGTMGGAGGDGGASTTGTMGGAGGSGGSGGAGGACSDACVTNADCADPTPVCAHPGPGCNGCYGPCNGAQCMGSNTCVSDADCNGSPDAKCVCAPNGCTMCVLGFSGSPPGFPEVLGEGVWLIGWSGGLDHYSWVRFAFDTKTTGTFTLLDAEGVTLTPFYPCEGAGTFTANLATGVVVLELPAACNMPAPHLDFMSLFDPGGFPPHATLAASIFTSGQPLSGFQHDAGFCDAGFTTCGDPFAP